MRDVDAASLFLYSCPAGLLLNIICVWMYVYMYMYMYMYIYICILHTYVV